MIDWRGEAGKTKRKINLILKKNIGKIVLKGTKALARHTGPSQVNYDLKSQA